MGVREGFLEERTSELVLGYLEIIQTKGDTMAKKAFQGHKQSPGSRRKRGELRKRRVHWGWVIKVG